MVGATGLRHIYRYLIAELDGTSWEPDDRCIWTPDRPGATH